jgi:transcriptional regulator with XRE-family HTH domain
MQPELKSHPIVEGLISVFGDWLKHRREMREMRNLDCRSFADIARDLRITPTDLDAFVRRGRHAADELPKLLKVLGIDEAALARSETAVLRDMERVCVLCERKAQCNNDLEIGASARDYEDYCLNAPTMNALRRGRKAQDA